MAVPTLAVLQIVVLEVVALRRARLRLELPRPEEVPVRPSPLPQMRECEQKQLPQSPWK